MQLGEAGQGSRDIFEELLSRARLVGPAEGANFAPLKKAVIAMRKHAYKLIAYFGYDNFDRVYELYDLENDPDELVDLSSRDSGKLKPLREELLTSLEKANLPFVRK